METIFLMFTNLVPKVCMIQAMHLKISARPHDTIISIMLLLTLLAKAIR